MRAALFAALLLPWLAVPAAAAPARFLSGDPADAPGVALQGPALLLGGGGTDVDAALQATIDTVRGCRDCPARIDVVVLRASGGDGYNDYLLGMHGVDSVETLLLAHRDDSGRADLLNTVRAAELVFFAGGDQCDYVRLVAGTPLADAVRSVHARGGAVGGTSAGMAIQGGIVFDACTGGAASADILADPYHPTASLSAGFLGWPVLQGVLTDQHFVERDRMGRLLGFLARALHDGLATGQLLGVAADEQTSILVGPDGIARVYGNGAGRAYFVLAEAAPGDDATVEPGRPLSWRGFRVWIRGEGSQFELGGPGRNGAADRRVDVIDGRLTADPY